MDDQLISWKKEVDTYLESIDFNAGERIWTNYETVIGFLVRLQEIHNEISWQEVTNEASPERKRFRTMIIDSSIDRLERVAAYESRKITAMQLEANLDK